MPSAYEEINRDFIEHDGLQDIQKKHRLANKDKISKQPYSTNLVVVCLGVVTLIFASVAYFAIRHLFRPKIRRRDQRKAERKIAGRNRG